MVLQGTFSKAQLKNLNATVYKERVAAGMT